MNTTKIKASVNTVNGSIFFDLSDNVNDANLIMSSLQVSDFKSFSHYDFSEDKFTLFIDVKHFSIKDGVVEFDFSELKAERELEGGEF